jgi:hypothetical protein
MKTFLSALLSQPPSTSRTLGQHLRICGVLLLASWFVTAACASEWSCDFESAEGFAAGRSAAGVFINVIGGQATIVAGDAASGVQFLQFTPDKRENALVFTLSGDAATSRNRSIQFAFRLTGDPEKSRLVLSCGQTILLRPVAGAIELEVGDKPVRRLTAPTSPGVWLRLEIREDAATQTWSLLVSGLPALAGLPIDEHKDKISDVLIFADGMLDLDAVRVVAGVEDAPLAQDSAKSSRTAPATVRQRPTPGSSEWAQWYGDLVSQAVRSAAAGNIAEAKDALEAVCQEKKGKAQWHLEMAQLLGMVAHAVHDAGNYRSAMVVALEALKQTEAADANFTRTEDKRTKAHSAFIAGRMRGAILADPDEAERQYHRAVTIDDSFLAARESENQLALRPKLAGAKK